MISEFNHFSFTVSDVQESIDYYTRIIGLELISLAGRPLEYVEQVTGISNEMCVAYLRGYGIVLELIEYIGSEKRFVRSNADNIGCGHICFNVDDLMETVGTMKAKGVKFLGEPVTIPAGTNKGGLIVYALAPDGIVTEFIQPPVR
jgi:catechol 2,3-dioxygenase-like lactoylglutathione lyase family enzyme